jgi:outer membrane protein TolC
MKLHRARHAQQSIFSPVSLSKAVLAAFYWCLSMSASGQGQPTPKPETTPLIPSVEQPSATPSPEIPGQLPQKGAEQEIKPLIPSIQSPSPTPQASPKPLAPQTAQELDQQFQEALKIRRLRPKNLLSLSLIDSVRLALAQNSDLRLAAEDVQAARGARKQATGEFDSKITSGAGYQRIYLSGGGGGNVPQAQFSNTFQLALANVLRRVNSDPTAFNDLDTVIAQAFNAAQGQGATTAIDTYKFDATVEKKFRNGFSASITYAPDFQNLDGKATWPPFKHGITILLSLPISKYGNVANSGPEMAAIKDYEGSILTMAHTATKATSSTLNAYWKSVASIEKFNIADRSYRINDALLSLTEELVKSDAAPQSDLSLARAKKVESAANRNAALIEIFNSSKDLASTLGLRGDQLRTLPYAYDQFPSLTEAKLAQLDEWHLIDLALARRFDRQAALKSIEAKRILAEKARIDLRPDFSVGFGGGMELVDDSQTGQPNKTGYTVNPSFGGSVTFSYAPANNAKEGAALSAQADLDKAVISMEDVSRGITLNLKTDLETIRDLLKQIRDNLAAAKNYTQNLTDMREKFRLGAATLIDTVQAEERLDAAEISLIDARSQLAQTIAQLRYESATLVDRDVVYRVPSFPKAAEQISITAESLTTLPDLSKEPGPAIKDRYYEPNVKYISGRPPWHH